MPTTETAPTAANPTVPADLPCVVCGYNLRTLAENGRCPECGAAISATLRSWLRLRLLAPGLRRGAATLAVAILLPTAAVLAFTGWTLVSAPYWTQMATRGTWPAILNRFLGRALGYASLTQVVLDAVTVALWLWSIRTVSGPRCTWLARGTTAVALGSAAVIVGYNVYIMAALPFLGPGPFTANVVLALTIAPLLAALALIVAWGLVMRSLKPPVPWRVKWPMRIIGLLLLTRLVAPLAALVAYEPPPTTMVFEITSPEGWRRAVLLAGAWSSACRPGMDLALLACLVLLVRALRTARVCGDHLSLRGVMRGAAPPPEVSAQGGTTAITRNAGAR